MAGWLNQSELHNMLLYNEDTGIFTWKSKPHGKVQVGDIAGTKKDGYIIIKINKVAYRAHRLAFLYKFGYLPENDIDHIDKNRSNNKWSNLREVSKQCNQRNCSIAKNNKTKVIGVSFDEWTNKWIVSITINRVRKHLGRFSDFLEAVFHRYCAEQCLGWHSCSSASSAHTYIINNMGVM